MQIGADAAGLEEGRASGCLMLYDHDQIVVAVRGLDQYQRTLECFLRAFQREVAASKLVILDINHNERFHTSSFRSR